MEPLEHQASQRTDARASRPCPDAAEPPAGLRVDPQDSVWQADARVPRYSPSEPARAAAAHQVPQPLEPADGFADAVAPGSSEHQVRQDEAPPAPETELASEPGAVVAARASAAAAFRSVEVRAVVAPKESVLASEAAAPDERESEFLAAYQPAEQWATRSPTEAVSGALAVAPAAPEHVPPEQVNLREAAD